MAEPLVSIVLCTYNRLDQLRGAVNACLAQQAGVAHELIVVDNNSNDGTREWVSRRIAAGEPRLRYVFEPRQGLPHARNAGIANARGEIIAFTDDDVIVASDWVESIRRTFDSHPAIDMTGGKVIPRWPAVVPAWFSRLQWAPLALQDKGDAPVVVDAANAAPCLIGASMAFRRNVFDRIGGFDVTFTRSQDREIQLRLWRGGGRGLYEPSIVAWVDVPPDRLTKQHFRMWYTRFGGYASRMGLLDQIDRAGRLVEPSERSGYSLLGCPGYVYRGAVRHLGGWLSAQVRRDEAIAFFHENRVRYLLAYIRARAAQRRHPAEKAVVSNPLRGELS